MGTFTNVVRFYNLLLPLPVEEIYRPPPLLVYIGDRIYAMLHLGDMSQRVPGHSHCVPKEDLRRYETRGGNFLYGAIFMWCVIL